MRQNLIKTRIASQWCQLKSAQCYFTLIFLDCRLIHERHATAIDESSELKLTPLDCKPWQKRVLETQNLAHKYTKKKPTETNKVGYEMTFRKPKAAHFPDLCSTKS